MGCQVKKPVSQIIHVKSYPNLIKDFENELNLLKKENIESIDSATVLFNRYRIKTEDINQVDSLFQPYFSVYNIGNQLLIGKPDSLVHRLGFKIIKRGEDELIMPDNSEYLKENIIRYLSKPMQLFTTQQLKEFGPITLSQRIEYTLWWENFNKNNPNFFLIEMADYHYKFWHLKKLIYKAFNKEGVLDKDIIIEYQRIIKEYPESYTTQTINDYLLLIEQCDGGKNREITEFCKQFKPE